MPISKAISLYGTTKNKETGQITSFTTTFSKMLAVHGVQGVSPDTQDYLIDQLPTSVEEQELLYALMDGDYKLDLAKIAHEYNNFVQAKIETPDLQICIAPTRRLSADGLNRLFK